MMILSFLLLFCGVSAFDSLQDDDLVTYKTLPQIRALKWDVSYYDRSAVAPGYWFVSPYFVNEVEPKTNRWMPCQIGPYIFDQDGELVWAGSCEFENRNVFDFHMVDNLGDKPYLAMMLQPEWGNPESRVTAVFYDNQYKPAYTIPDPAMGLDLHDINVKGPHEALAMVYFGEERDLSAFGQPERSMGVLSGGFIAFDPTSGQVLWEWRLTNQIPLDESTRMNPDDLEGTVDYIHVNSIDKNENGDYLMSCRHSDTLYLISGQDGHIIWRLGGKKNDFAKDFGFARQHHARFVSVDGPRMVVSVLDNGADDYLNADPFAPEKPTSAGLYIELDTVAMTATVLNRYSRPDGGSTDKRGSMQALSNGNVLVSWSKNGYMSEFAHDGRLLMDATFVSERYSTYRAYKFPWWSRPSYPPTLVASCYGVYGVNGSELSTVFHVSWNGATEVKYWRFYARADGWSFNTEIGTVPKTGFETSYIARGFMDLVSVEALDENHVVLSQSPVVHTTPPEYWPQDAKLPEPDDPEAVTEVVEDASYSTVEPTKSKRRVLYAVTFLAGCLFSLAGYYLIQLLYPRFKQYARWTYSQVQSDDPEMDPAMDLETDPEMDANIPLKTTR
ncbi:uncharacterized protein N7459_006016 [Penicillium hispanicum]|uniref:uncharacterized protein n=1 Tax=Penicillium hispanicum TaxID=1080232 RepID=UPI002540AC6A|nr:uncharacterized protein N7459_006016 [Penicillium hispanicum]KAJ5580031.1 hypothetical protein N7459_006016 [Penicillium hispanicum]